VLEYDRNDNADDGARCEKEVVAFGATLLAFVDEGGEVFRGG
jgi:hypothetical protein